MENLVSIVTPTFNSEAFIAQTIESVQNQTHQNWEMIIVDDCSTDNTVNLVIQKAKSDNRIRLYKLENNSGAGVARNHAINKSIGKYISFLDSDDLWKVDKLEKQLNFLIINKLPFTFSFYECIDEDGKLLNRRVEAPLDLSYKQLFFCNHVGNLTGIYDVNYFGKIPITFIRKRQDWIMWLTILKKIKTAKVTPESLAYYRIRQESISSSKFDLIKYNFNVYRNHHKFNLVISLICMIIFLFTQLLVKPRYVKRLN
jgi:teichuronic acid biosynthesis glycosyltransferase TuaG